MYKAGGHDGLEWHMPEPPPAYRWVIFWTLAMIAASRIPLGVSLGILLPAITEEFHLTPAEQGWLGSAVSVDVFLAIPAAWLVSRFRPRRFLNISLTVGALLTGLQALAPSYLVLALARVAIGTVGSAYQPARTLLVQGWFPVGEMTLIGGMQVAVIGVVEAVTFVVTAPLAGLLGGWRPVMLLLAIVSAACLASWWLLARDAPVGRAQEPAGPEVSPLRVMVDHQALWPIGAGLLAAASAWWAFVTFWPSYMLARYGMPLETSGFLFSFTSLGMTPGALLVGWWCSRHSAARAPVLVGSGLVLTITSWGLLLTDYPPLVLVLTCAQGLAWGFVPLITAAPYHLPGIVGRQAVVAVTLMGWMGNVGPLLGPGVTGVLAQAVGSMAVALGVISVLYGMLIVSALATWRAGSRLPATPAQKAT